VKKGNPIGFLDSEIEKLIDTMIVEQERKKYRTMSRQEWKMVGLFFLKHFIRLVNRKGAPTDTDLENVLAILVEDGSVDIEKRDQLSLYVDLIMEERDQRLSTEDDIQDRETALEPEISLLKNQAKWISAKGELELELMKSQEVYIRKISPKYFYCVFGGIQWRPGVLLRLQLAPVILKVCLPRGMGDSRETAGDIQETPRDTERH